MNNINNSDKVASSAIRDVKATNVLYLRVLAYGWQIIKIVCNDLSVNAGIGWNSIPYWFDVYRNYQRSLFTAGGLLEGYKSEYELSQEEKTGKNVGSLTVISKLSFERQSLHICHRRWPTY